MNTAFEKEPESPFLKGQYFSYLSGLKRQEINDFLMSKKIFCSLKTAKDENMLNERALNHIETLQKEAKQLEEKANHLYWNYWKM